MAEMGRNPACQHVAIADYPTQSEQSTSSLRKLHTVAPSNPFHNLDSFLRERMSMSNVYQPVVVRVLLRSGGIPSSEQIARALLAEDHSQIEYYEAVTRDMVGRIFRKN